MTTEPQGASILCNLWLMWENNQMSKNKLTLVQRRVLRAIAGGAVIKAHIGGKGSLCFSSDAEGIRGTLYLTLTCRSLLQRQYIDVNNREVIVLTPTGEQEAANS